MFRGWDRPSNQRRFKTHTETKLERENKKDKTPRVKKKKNFAHINVTEFLK